MSKALSAPWLRRIRPVAVVGQLYPRMLRDVPGRFGLRLDELAVAGDRLYTDVDMAHATGAVAGLLPTELDRALKEARGHR